MKKSTRNLILGIGMLGILSGVYSMFTGGELFNIIFGFFIGASLIGSVYYDQSGKSKE